MREVDVNQLRDHIKRACGEINFHMGKDVEAALNEAVLIERSPIGKSILSDILRNADIANKKQMPTCQDTGMIVIFLEVGQEIHFVGGNLNEAIQQGIREGYRENFLRKSIVSCPIERINSNDNTPGIIYTDIVDGDRIKLSIGAKGFGSENMSKTKMLKPSDGIEGIKAFVIETVAQAGSNPCPPIVVGVGIGGTIDKAAQIAKKALMRDLGKHHPSIFIETLEKELIDRINDLGIGPQGLGGNTTALGVCVETFPTHIAGLPVAVNINCHASRHITIEV